MSRSRNPPQKGQGAARAKQMGLLLDLSPDGGLDDSGGNEEELEAELFALIGGGGGGVRPPGKKDGGKVPVPMEDIDRMAALCMKDLDEDGEDDADLDDADLLAELNEVLEADEKEVIAMPTPAPTPSQHPNVAPRPTPTVQSGAGGLESRLQERLDMYQTAITNAKAAGETSKARRYDRGLKTLQSMLSSVKKGQPINEEEIPPPVATGGKPTSASDVEPVKEQEQLAPKYTPQSTNAKPVALPKPQLLRPPTQRETVVTPDTPAISPLTPSQPNAEHSELKASVLGRQREYKLAALQAKQCGDTELAKQHYLIAKKLDSVVEAVDRGEPIDAGSLPPPPGVAVVAQSPALPQSSSSKPVTTSPLSNAPLSDTPLPAPRSLAEALQQRLDKYKNAAELAKSKGDDRKARMHQRIIKQYQDAIKSHKAGRPVNLADLPVPPGCPPLQGSESGEQNFIGVLETAMKLANQDADAEEEGEPEEEVAKVAARSAAPKARTSGPANASSPATPPASSTGTPKLGTKAQQQLDFLLNRRQQFVKAALRSKQMKDMQGAAQHLRNAKGLDPMITAAKGGLPVDISKVPCAPASEEDYSLSQSRSRASALSPRSAQQYAQLMERLKLQHEKCLTSSQHFTHMGNVAETVRFEKLGEECMNNIELLKKCHAKGLPVPSYHTEERTFNTVKIFPNLTASEMLLTIVKGLNLPTPPGVSASDLDPSVRFEFPFPSAEEAQKDKTNTVKSTNCPEFKEQFKLHINRTHRGFKRVVQTKGIKFEVIHKGSLFKTDKVVGNAQLKLEALENHCEIREIIEVLDGRKPTGGKLEVRVRIREPLGGVQLQSVTEKWLVLDPPTITPDRERHREREHAPAPKSKPRDDHGKKIQTSFSPPQYKLHSFSLLNYDKERLERKIGEYTKSRQDPPPDLINQHKEVCHRLHWQKSYLERGSSATLAEYDNVLRRFAHGLADSVKKFSSEGNREAAKDALGRLKMVENEMESLRRRRGV
ncbi:coiled-coil and C2 domain-containing protein 1A [Electrophorus electricus]|uniref:coiled-coil and C2 domain-containing protein 1A n=1 Tax=Electrophorus electricus TaxID=8005 RepID=UPI0015D0993D|nr:coiled-coil and C2 domain-containing protein 1A [Electrophorus electricus]